MGPSLVVSLKAMLSTPSRKKDMCESHVTNFKNRYTPTIFNFSFGIFISILSWKLMTMTMLQTKNAMNQCLDKVNDEKSEAKYQFSHRITVIVVFMMVGMIIW